MINSGYTVVALSPGNNSHIHASLNNNQAMWRGRTSIKRALLQLMFSLQKLYELWRASLSTISENSWSLHSHAYIFSESSNSTDRRAVTLRILYVGYWDSHILASGFREHHRNSTGDSYKWPSNCIRQRTCLVGSKGCNRDYWPSHSIKETGTSHLH